MTKEPVNVADIFARYENTDLYVAIRRFIKLPGLALVGGKMDPGENIEETAEREFAEEVGMSLKINHFLGTYDTPGRDPRTGDPDSKYYGREFISHTYIGIASGIPVAEQTVDEKLKTAPMFFTKDEMLFFAKQNAYIVDHGQMVQDYFDRYGS